MSYTRSIPSLVKFSGSSRGLSRSSAIFQASGPGIMKRMNVSDQHQEDICKIMCQSTFIREQDRFCSKFHLCGISLSMIPNKKRTNASKCNRLCDCHLPESNTTNSKYVSTNWKTRTSLTRWFDPVLCPLTCICKPPKNENYMYIYVYSIAS